MNILTKRLQTVADLIGKTGTLIDVGCDHGYLPIYLLSKGDISFAYLTDIREGPLESARKNIAKYGFSKETELIKSDGLINLRDKKTDAVSICGMGGRMISKILGESLEFSKKADRLVLQPMTEAYVLREFLRDNGFQIEKEALAREDDRFYNIICAKSGKEKNRDLFSMYFGNLEILKNDPLLIPYLEKNYRIFSKNYEAKKGKEDTKDLEILLEMMKKALKK